MLFKKKKIGKFFIFSIFFFVIILIYLFSITPGLKGDLEQSLRILLKQPVLLKSKFNKDNKVYDYSSKIFYAIENLFSNQKNFENIKIDISFLELEKLKSDRKKALELKQLDNPQKVRINVIYNGKNYPASARLKGDLSEHWGNIKQWSLRIKLRNKQTIFSMNEFSITVFIERDFPYNFIISEVFRKYGVLTPRYKTVKVDFNGIDWGLMLLEEQFHDSFYAFNKIKEAPIFKMTNEHDFLINVIADKNVKNLADISKWQGKLETKVFNKNEILEKTNIPGKKTNENLVSIFKTLQEIIILNDKNYTSNLIDYIDVKSFARASVITAIFGDWHSSYPHNSRYYLNPYDLKIRPILTDTVHSIIDNDFYLNHNLFYKSIFKLEEFQVEYFRVLNEIHNNFAEIEKIFLEACEGFGKNCINLVELDILKKNILFLINKKKEIFFTNTNSENEELKINNFNTKNSQNLNKKKIHFRIFNTGELNLYNLTSEKILIKNVTFNIKKDCQQNCQDIEKKIELNHTLNPSSYKKINFEKLKLKNKGVLGNLVKLNYSDENNDSFVLFEKIENIAFSKKNLFMDTKEINEYLNLNDKNYVLKKNIYEIKKPIIIPSGYNLKIESGSILKMDKDTFIMVENGLVEFDAENKDPIIIEALDKKSKWNGIYVNSDIDEKNFSILRNVEISDYSYFDNNKIQLTGGVNFINAKLILENSKFKNSLAEDAINLVNSKFKINDLNVFNANSDGIDIDFGEGKIVNSKFHKILGDGIDLSGSKISIKDIKAKNVADKAISVGEASFLEIDELEVHSSRIGIASKDSSEVIGSKIKIMNCGLFDFAVYQKKSYFSGAFLNVEAKTNCKNSIVQNGSKLVVNEKNLNTKNFDTKKLYDGTL